MVRMLVHKLGNWLIPGIADVHVCARSADNNWLALVLCVTANKCTSVQYLYDYAAFYHQGSCFVTYHRHSIQLSWYGAATHCIERGGSLASFDTQSTADVSFVRPSYIPRCTWVGLVKKFFQWTVINRKYIYLNCLQSVVSVGLSLSVAGVQPQLKS